MTPGRRTGPTGSDFVSTASFRDIPKCMAEETLDRTIRRHPDGRTVTATVTGEWDSWTDGTLIEELRRVLDEGYRNVILDATAVSFCDSVCVGALVGIYQLTTGRDGWLRIVAPNFAVRRPVELTALDQILDLYPTLEQAENPPPSHQNGQT
jgi:anti-sigma B factor antagonist